MIIAVSIMGVDNYGPIWYVVIILQWGYTKDAYSKGGYYYSEKIGSYDR